MDCYRQHIENRMPRREVQWQWLPAVILFLVPWFYGAWKLIERIL